VISQGAGLGALPLAASVFPVIAILVALIAFGLEQRDRPLNAYQNSN
jgi:hypothetical protein